VPSCCTPAKLRAAGGVPVHIPRRTTGQGAAPNKGNVSVNVTPEMRTQIHQVFIMERSAPRVDRVDFDLSVGTAVPRSVRFIPVPKTHSNRAELARV
jgi:hypothetical protein